MKYFKLIDDNLIIGVITSNNFMHYSILTDSYSRANEQIGEYVSYKGKLYRSGWMQPYLQIAPYKEIAIIEIEKDEYDKLLEAFQITEVIETAQEEEVIQPEEIDIELNRDSLEFIRTTKINEMSYACRTTIEAGFDLELRGETHHFSLSTQDQLNLMSLNTLINTTDEIPYHADGEEVVFYTSEEISKIINAANSLKIYHTTYYNALKNYIKALETIEEISAITYGTPIPEEYKTEVLRALE